MLRTFRFSHTLRVSDSCPRITQRECCVIKIKDSHAISAKSPVRAGSVWLAHPIQSLSACVSHCSSCPCGFQSCLPLIVGPSSLVQMALSLCHHESGSVAANRSVPFHQCLTPVQRRRGSNRSVPYHATVGPWRDLQGQKVWGRRTGTATDRMPPVATGPTDPPNCWGTPAGAGYAEQASRALGCEPGGPERSRA